ncbi:MAG: Ribosomal RNA small subunit methyltransferase C [uncultured Quadrisphaera sp.]|uniref:Ribosomal RNA small subunit methyltransferase C n=1 Tax=uncultured Quadrisphaera sp. TaxID=904978 RepID=A0A6J4Q0V3_9ACTN|nr:MAG: Ribosomal RNA small subunit methyltransferase C [uncultured Quadrisphaera sp.]
MVGGRGEEGAGAATGGSHYFSPVPAGTGERRPLRVELAGAERELETAGGVFSPDRLDAGTSVLLATAPPPPPRGDLVDVGCGWGALALSMALRAPEATVWAVDVNPRALEVTAANAARLGLPGVRAVLPEQVPPGLEVAALWSNPPIRVGKELLHRLLLTWLPRLGAGAEAHLVVQRHLGADSLQRWLQDEGLRAAGVRAPVERVRSARGYRVLRVGPVATSAADAPGVPAGGPQAER